jgi:hypothetical protein
VYQCPRWSFYLTMLSVVKTIWHRCWMNGIWIGSIGGMILTGESLSIQKETCLTETLSTKNRAWTDKRSNQGHYRKFRLNCSCIPFVLLWWFGCFVGSWMDLDNERTYKSAVWSFQSTTWLGCPSFILESVLGHVSTLFQNEFSTECDLVLPPSIFLLFP